MMKTQEKKQVRSKLGEVKQMANFKFSNPTEIMKQYADVIKIANSHAQTTDSDPNVDAFARQNLFIVEKFQEYSDGNDDRVASQSGEQTDHDEPDKDTGATANFIRLIQELNSIGTLQSVLAISTINQSIDFSSAKQRQTFISQSGLYALLKTLSCMVTEPLTLEDKQQYILNNLQRVEPKVGYEILTILCTLAESGHDSRRQLIQEDIVNIGLSLAKTQFGPAYTQAALFRAKAYRLLASVLTISQARNYTRRIQALPIILRHYRQAIKDYTENDSIDNATLICAITMCIESLLASKRCKEQLIRQQVVFMIKDALTAIPQSVPVSEDLIIQTGQNKRSFNPAEMLMETLTNSLKKLCSTQRGRNDIQLDNGIRRLCDILETSKSTKVIQQTVAVLALCAQDSDVDKAVRQSGGLSVLSKQLSSNDFQTLEAICQTIVSVCRDGPYFGCKASCFIESDNYLSFNKRNEENIIDLCQKDTVNSLYRLINQPIDILANSDNDKVVVFNENGTIRNGAEARQLVILGTNALVPLLSSKRGRSALRSNAGFKTCLTQHLSIGDVNVLISTLACIYTACNNDPEITTALSVVDPKAKQPQLNDLVKAAFSLLHHKNIQVVTAAAMALNPICRDQQRAFLIGREIPTALIQVSKLLLMNGPKPSEGASDDKSYGDYDFDIDETYLPYLVKEQKGWLMGIIAELSQDKENAKEFSEYNVLKEICDLQKEHSAATTNNGNIKPYIFYIDQLIKEKAALALASLSKISQNMTTVAEQNTIPSIVNSIMTPEGQPVMPIKSSSQKFLGTQILQCPNPYGFKVNFSLENQVRRKQEKQRMDVLKKNKALLANETDVDKDAQHTNDPYAAVNKAACQAMAQLSQNKLCALLLRQYGACYGLLTLSGSDDYQTQLAAAKALENIRIQHLNAMDLYKNRSGSELTYTEEQCIGKPDENIVYKSCVDNAFNKLYGEGARVDQQIIANNNKLIKQNSTMATMLKRTNTIDRIADPEDIELQDDKIFTQQTSIKIDQNAQTFTTCVGILKHPEVEEPIDVEQIAKEAQVATIDAFLKKQVIDEPVVVDQAGEEQQQQQKRLKPVIKQKPSRAAEPLGWKNPATENEKQIIEIFKRFGKDRVDIMDIDQLTDLLKYNVDESYLKGLIKINDSDNDGELDEQQFVEAYKTLSGMQKAQISEDNKLDQLFYTMDVMKDEKIMPDVYKQFCDRLGIESQIEEPIPKAEFRQKIPREVLIAFFGNIDDLEMEQGEEGDEEEGENKEEEKDAPTSAKAAYNIISGGMEKKDDAEEPKAEESKVEEGEEKKE